MSTTESIPFFRDPTGQEYLLAAEITTIGRAMENDIVIPSKRVSRKHARLHRQVRHLVQTDLGSINGTFLNDERVSAPVEVRNGDWVSIGDVILTL